MPGALVKNITRQHHHFPVSIKINSSFLVEKDSTKKCAWIPKFNATALENVTKTFTNEFLVPMSCGMGNWLPPLQVLEKENAEKMLLFITTTMKTVAINRLQELQTKQEISLV